MPIPAGFSPEFTTYISRLTDAAVTPEVKKGIAHELKEWNEQHRDPNEVSRYVPVEIPIIIQVLQNGEPATKRDSPEQQTRVALLQILERLPHTDNLSQFVVELQTLALHLLRTDNEELGILCVKIVINLNRTYRSVLEPHNRKFVEWMVELYDGMASVVEKLFSDDSQGASMSPSNSFGMSQGENESQQSQAALVPSSQSLKVIVECPIATVLFTGDQTVMEYSTLLVPASIKFLQLQVEQQRRAHEESAKSDSLWIGVAPDIKNRTAYTEFITAQTKVMSYIAIVFRKPHESLRSCTEVIPELTVRLLQDCPAEASNLRREILIAMRHILHDEIRPLFFNKLDALLDERVLMGNGVASIEGLRTLAYSTLADLVHHSRESLSSEQLARVIHAYSCNVHMMSLPCSTQTLSMKLLLNLVEQVTARCSKAEATRILMSLLETSIDKLGVLYRVYEDLVRQSGAQTQPDTSKDKDKDKEKEKEKEKEKADEIFHSFCAVERIKPVDNISYLVDNPDTVLRDAKQLYYTLLHVFKAVLLGLAKIEAPPPDAETLGPMFENGFKCLALYDRFNSGPAEKDIWEKVGDVFVALHPHVFQELWIVKMGFFMDQVHQHMVFLQVAQNLFAKESVSKQLVAVSLKYLVEDLDSLGNQDTKHAAATLRMFKMAFMAASVMPELNEHALVPYIPKIIVEAFPLAAKSVEPTHYYLLLRALFRAIGGHKFETMYPVVTPLLQELLETLNRLLITSPPAMRDLIAELCLTVPVRLTHLLPYLGHLMKPLVYALKAGPELVAQGLRTLELCVDNLTPEFLDPTLSPVLRELMGALHDILRPLPHPHVSAHTTIRILGKLGGRNRRLQHEPPQLTYLSGSHEAQVLLSFDGRNELIDIAPICRLAVKSIRHQHPTYRTQSFEVLKHTMSILVHKGCNDGQREEIFVTVAEGLFSAVNTPEHGAQAAEFLRDVTKHIFTTEGNSVISELTKRTNFTTIVVLHVKVITEALALVDGKDLENAKELVTDMIKDVIAIYRDPSVPEPVHRDMASILHLIMTSFLGLCWQDTVVKKMAGYYGIAIFTSSPEISGQWVQDRQHDIVKGLISILKDTPPDTVKNIDDVASTLIDVLKICFTPPPPIVGPDGEEKPAPTPTHANPANLNFALQMLMMELTSQSALLRKAARDGLEVLAQLTNQSVVELLMPNRDRLTTPIFGKPLRALPLAKQIGHAETINYCLSLRPPLLVVNDELWRMLNEALAIADTGDDNIGPQPMGTTPRQRYIKELVTKLRVACLNLLTAAIFLTEFYNGQPTIRQRVTAVYFKSLYWSTDDVKNAASDGLRTALQHQARLPKDLLHSGLMPILTNLADSKKLTLPNLDGLGRLMDLLTNHFKVEIGAKLIDHHRQLADEKMLREAASGPLSDNEEIQKVAYLVDIFHRLPFPGAAIFLTDLVNNVVESEAVMYSTSTTPFTAPLSAFFEKYPLEAVDYLYANVGKPRHVRTMRTVLTSKFAPKFNEEVINQLPRLISTCFENKDRFIAGLSICLDLAQMDPDEFSQREEMIQALLKVWLTEFSQEADVGYHQPMVQTRIATLLISIFKIVLERVLRLDVLFNLVTIFTQRVAIDLSGLARFIHVAVVVGAPLEVKRSIVKQFLTMFDEPNPPKDRITQFLRVVINPMITVTYTQKPDADAMDVEEKLIDSEIVESLNKKVWSVMAQGGFPAKEPSDALTIELIHMTGLLIQNCPELIHESRKDVMKSAWASVSSEDAVVEQASNLLIARFFKAFDSPSKLILKVWVGLLRPWQGNEGRHLIRQATDTLAPALPLRIKEDSSPPTWVKVTKRYLVEETGGLSPTIMIYRVIFRNSELFFPYRDNFAPHMITSLGKLFGNPAPETRLMTLDVLDHILRWERQRLQAIKDLASEEKDDKEKDADKKDAEPLSVAAAQYMLPVQLRDSCVQFLVRLVLQADAATKAVMVPKSLRILSEMLKLSGWEDIGVRQHIFDRMLAPPPNDEHLPHAPNALRLLQVTIEVKSLEWYLENLANIKKWLERPFNTNDPDMDGSLIKIFEKLIDALPAPSGEEDSTNPVNEFFAFTLGFVNEGIRSGTHPSLTLALLHILHKKTPGVLEELAQSIIHKLFAKYAREHISVSPPHPQHPPGQPRPPNEPATTHLKNLLGLFKTFVPASGDSRRFLIQGLSMLLEKSADLSVCRALLAIAREWVFVRSDGLPNMRDKAQFLSKMTCLEFKRFDDPIFTDFLNLILEIYKEPTLRRTDLTIKLESAFLVGCRSKDPVIRLKFIELFDDSLPRSLVSRLQWVLGAQTWEYLADQYWIPQGLELLLGSVADDTVLAPAFHDVDMSGGNASRFGTRPVTSSQLLRPLKQLLHLDADTTHQMWVITFTSLWRVLSRKEQGDIQKSLILLLAKDYQIRQLNLRRNVIQSLLSGVLGCQPPLSLPPFVIKYLGKTFNAWHVALELLQNSLTQLRDEDTVRDAALDALAELYAELSEDDMFYGLWRRRGLYPETNVALSFEQAGLWQDAQVMYEAAQLRARSGGAPFNEQEYCLWEDHWILTAQKLQQWDTLTELANQEGNHDLLLECAWRLSDWEKDRETIEHSILSVAEVATPRRRVFEAYTCLIRGNPMGERPDFTRLLEDAMQLSLRKWISLPPAVSTVHIPLLQHFQQLVELQEAAQIFHALATTTAGTLEKRSGELKVVLQAWRERLPNLWDDISVWSDLVSWRQHVFTAINKKFIPLIPPNPANGGNTQNSTAGYRGFHEIAWIINRFAHVARKHQLLEVCHTSLAKIYTLPNIEISEAFLKLREQARCHYQVPSELQAGLEVINNTNLMYFSVPQKAEFFTLKGMFIAKLGDNDAANAAFGQAVQMDLNMPKAWAEWGRYNDRTFKESPTEMVVAGNAVSCYLQAAGLYKNSKTRPLLIRILWFLSMDDSTAIISKAFENFKGDIALWYWITLIPQLLKALSHRAARHARRLLIDLARTYPQALFFELRTSREEFHAYRKQAANSMIPNQNGVSDPSNPSANGQLNGEGDPATQRTTAHPWEFVDEISNVLKTTTPLLHPSLELVAENIIGRFKPTPEEEIYRFILALLSEALHHLVNRSAMASDDGSVPEACLRNVVRLAEGLPAPNKSSFEHDLVTSKPTMKEYVERLVAWRDRYENVLALRPKVQPLDILSHWLAEFQHHLYEDVEVPGQYLEHTDNAAHFVRIARLGSSFSICRGNAYYFRRLTFMGHDGTKHPFAAQHPSLRACRREERVMQLFRILNTSLARRKESRKRNLAFYLPHAVPMSQAVRLLENDDTYVTLQDIYEQQCHAVGFGREDPIFQWSLKIRQLVGQQQINRLEYMNFKMELIEEIATKQVPRNTMTKFFTRTMAGPMDLWLMRKQFTLQVAAMSFMTYVLYAGSRTPARISISKQTGRIYASEVIPALAPQQPVLALNETVPFRLTPNMQDFITENGMEGLLVTGINAIARCLTEPEYELEQQLGLFMREEVLQWYHTQNKTVHPDIVLRSQVQQNVDAVVRRAEIMACKLERDTAQKNTTTSATLAVDNLVSQATNPQFLAGMPEQWHPYL